MVWWSRGRSGVQECILREDASGAREGHDWRDGCPLGKRVLMVISKKKEERRGGKDAVKEGFKKIKKGAKFLWFFFFF